MAFVVARIVQELILRRPQRGASLEMLRVDDAMRSMSATSFLALGYGVSAVMLGVALSTVAAGMSGWQAATLAVLSGICNLAGFAVAIGFLNLNHHWVVPRLRNAQ